MAELADAYGSGPYECKFMQVQVLLSAPVESLDAQVAFGAFALLRLCARVYDGYLFCQRFPNGVFITDLSYGHSFFISIASFHICIEQD